MVGVLLIESIRRQENTTSRRGANLAEEISYLMQKSVFWPRR
jgi:hypothetical protein